MGRSTLEYASLISGAPFAGLLPIPPHWDSRLPISIRVPGTPAQQPARLSHACRQRETVGVLELSCCAFVRNAAEQHNCSPNSVAVAALRACSVRQTRPLKISCASARDTRTFVAVSATATGNSDCHT
ncbi:hypothetical protein MRX96_018125 [Rhipicephalus microplus]